MLTRNCDECKHFDKGLWCIKEHKPRFYAPKTISQAQRGDFGWKRKCDDFEQSQTLSPDDIV